MFYAISKTTGNKVSSINLSENPTYAYPEKEEWLADPDEIENWEEIKEKYPEVKVVYVNDAEYFNYNGKKVIRAPHFRIPNATEMGINIIPERKEHKLAKNWIYNRIHGEGGLNLIYSSVNKPHRYENKIAISSLNINKNLLGVEPIIKNGFFTRRVDVIVPFNKQDKFFGRGIVFEVQFSNQKDKTKEKRTDDRILQGYSVVWLNESDFNLIDDETIELKKPEVSVEAFAPSLREVTKKQIKNLKITLQEEFRKVEQKHNELKDELDEFEKQIKLKKDFLKVDIKNHEYYNEEALRKIYDEYVKKFSVEIRKDIIQDINSSFFTNNYDEIQEIIETLLKEEIRQGYLHNLNDFIANEVSNIDISEIKEKAEAKIDKVISQRTLENNPPSCLDCNQNMILKKGLHGHFWGCPNYPICKSTRQLTRTEKEMVDG